MRDDSQVWSHQECRTATRFMERGYSWRDVALAYLGLLTPPNTSTGSLSNCEREREFKILFFGGNPSVPDNTSFLTRGFERSVRTR